jgi:hypothetical protein
MVEAGGKGTLHIHLLVWLTGNVTTNHLRDRLDTDTSFRTKMQTYLDTVVKEDFDYLLPLLNDAAQRDAIQGTP